MNRKEQLTVYDKRKAKEEKAMEKNSVFKNIHPHLQHPILVPVPTPVPRPESP